MLMVMVEPAFHDLDQQVFLLNFFTSIMQPSMLPTSPVLTGGNVLKLNLIQVSSAISSEVVLHPLSGQCRLLQLYFCGRLHTLWFLTYILLH